MKPFTTIAVIVFSFIAFMHLLRLFFFWEITINGMVVPVWLSVLGFLISSGLALMLWRESHK
jgi:membrane protein implicated in regulation of membrane protease activity